MKAFLHSISQPLGVQTDIFQLSSIFLLFGNKKTLL